MNDMEKQKEKYDVIIVGAGPAGAQCARELSKKGKKVLLIEKSKEIGWPNFSSGGTPKELFKDFNLPMDLAAGEWSKILVAAKNLSKTWDYGKARGYVLDFAEFKRFLVRDAIKHGAEILIGTSVKSSIIKNGIVAGVAHGGIFGEGEVFADMVVDASGPAGVLACDLGLRKKSICSLSVGIEVIAENIPREMTKTLAFYFGREYVPYGYGWIFPMGESSAKVGVAVYNAAERGVSNMMEILKKFMLQFPQLRNAAAMDLHGASLYANGGLKRHFAPGFLFIGDAAAQINPLAGEGIRHVMHSARIASEIIAQAIDKKDFSEKILCQYDKKWKKYTGTKWKQSLLISKKIYGDISGEEMDKFIKLISKLSAEDVFEIGFNYDFKRILKKDIITGWLKGMVK